jgi:hypothetical protein
MINPLRTSLLPIGLGLGIAACGVADSDTSLWTPTKDYGGTQFKAGAADPGPGSSGAPATTRAGGDGNVPPPQGGAPPGTGNTSSVGTGGFVGGGNGGSGEVFPGAGGFVTGTGGVITGSGGSILGMGGSSVGMGGGANPGTGGMPITGNSGKCAFTFDVTTVTARGRYAPVNVGAVWITDAQNKFVKTIALWGRIRLSNATAWVQGTGSNRTDVTTAASRTSHGPLTNPAPKWDCTDVSKNAVPDGAYVVHVTFAESDANPFFPGTPIQATTNFTKSSAGADVSGQDTANFTGMHVKLTPQ